MSTKEQVTGSKRCLTNPLGRKRQQLFFLLLRRENEAREFYLFFSRLSGFQGDAKFKTNPCLSGGAFQNLSKLCLRIKMEIRSETTKTQKLYFLSPSLSLYIYISKSSRLYIPKVEEIYKYISHVRKYTWLRPRRLRPLPLALLDFKIYYYCVTMVK